MGKYFNFNIADFDNNSIVLFNTNKPQSIFNLHCGFYVEAFLDIIYQRVRIEEKTPEQIFSEEEMERICADVQPKKDELCNRISTKQSEIQQESTDCGCGLNIHDLLSFYIIQNSIRISNFQKQKAPIIPNLLDIVKNLNTEDTIKTTSEYSKLVNNQDQLILDLKFLIDKRNVLNEDKIWANICWCV